MSTIAPGATQTRPSLPDEAPASPRFDNCLPTLLSVIAGMVDLISFLSLGIFTAHITGNIVVIGALVARHGRVNRSPILAIPVFIVAVVATWLLAKASRKHGRNLMRFLLLACVLIFSVVTNPSAKPHGLMAGIAAMMAVSAMACQFALLRLTLPVAPSTAVMTGNLTNAVLSLIDSNSRTKPVMTDGTGQLKASLHLLIGFFAGCVVAAAALSPLGEWAWLFPAALAGVILALVK